MSYIINTSEILYLDRSQDDFEVLKSIDRYIDSKIALYLPNEIYRYILRYSSDIQSKVKYIIDDRVYVQGKSFLNIPIVSRDAIDCDIFTIEDLKKLDFIPKRAKFFDRGDNSFYRAIPNLTFKYNIDKERKLIESISEYLQKNSIQTKVIDIELYKYFNSIAPFESNEEGAFICSKNIESINKHREKNSITLFELLDRFVELVPEYGFNIYEKSIYPIDVPKIEIESNLDILLLDLPAKKDASMPNGFGYLHNKIKSLPFKSQTIDIDVILYHNYHQKRILDGEVQYSKDGYELPQNPWLDSLSSEWDRDEFLSYFQNDIEEIANKIIKSKPKAIGLSLHFSNIEFSTKVIKRVKEKIDIPVLVGGMSCTNHKLGKDVFPLADYIFIGEAELTIETLLNRLINGEVAKDLDGIISKFDSKNRIFKPAPLFFELDELSFPTYDWFDDVNIYTRYNGYKPAQVIASRGCKWAKCTFCAECFTWRQRSAKNVVDELEWLYNNGFDKFSFNESDFNADPEKIYDMCQEVIDRGLKINMMGQLRIDHRNSKELFDIMYRAGFTEIRFGVDGWSKNALRLQKKGYPKRFITQNLQDCALSGLLVDTNMVVAVPGESDNDLEESIEFALEHKDYIREMAFIHPLMLFAGSQYFESPDEFNIKFTEDKEEIYKKHPHYIPGELWYSVEPYIDDKIRNERFEYVCMRLLQGGMRIGRHAQTIAEKRLKNMTMEEIVHGKK